MVLQIRESLEEEGIKVGKTWCERVLREKRNVTMDGGEVIRVPRWFTCFMIKKPTGQPGPGKYGLFLYDASTVKQEAIAAFNATGPRKMDVQDLDLDSMTKFQP